MFTDQDVEVVSDGDGRGTVDIDLDRPVDAVLEPVDLPPGLPLPAALASRRCPHCRRRTSR